MAVTYRLDVFDLNGDRQFMITDFLDFAYTINVNAPGMLAIGVSGEHSLLETIEDKWQIDVWRRPEGLSWVREISTLFRSIEWDFTDKSKARLICPGIKSMLDWRIVNWATGTANRSAFVAEKAETIAKTLVDYNAGVNATVSNGRKREGAISGVSVQADGALGNTLNWYCHGRNILETIQELTLVAGGDFDLVKTSSTTYEFRWYDGQLGTDRSSTITFAMKYGNMGSPSYNENRSKERTVAAVWGQGEGASRNYVTRTSDAYSASNDIEMYVDARDIDLGDTSGLNTRGDKKLREMGISRSFGFTTIQTPSTLYGVDYFLGDKVTAINPFNENTETLKVNSVAVSLSEDGSESIEPEFTSLL